MPTSVVCLLPDAGALSTYSICVEGIGPSGGGPGGTNKAMATLLNPSGSGKVIILKGWSVQCSANVGTNVIVHYQLRRITAHSGGTAVTPHRRDSNDGASIAEVIDEPASVTGGALADNVQDYIMQANTAISPRSNFLPFGVVGEKPMILRPGEGLVSHQITSNGGTFHTGFVWTEDAIIV